MKNTKSRHIIESCETVPANNIYGISASLPTMKDIFNYEINENDWRKKMKSAYPRFFVHQFERRLYKILKNKFSINDKHFLFLFSCEKSARYVAEFFSLEVDFIAIDSICCFVLSKDHLDYRNVKGFIQNTGFKVYTRQLESVLNNLENENKKTPLFSDNSYNEASDLIKSSLAEIYRSTIDNVKLCSSGMSAIFSTFQAVKKYQDCANKDLFVQFGALYLDTEEIIKKYSNSYKQIVSVANLAELQEFINENSDRVAAVFTEIPTNPLIECVDLKELYSICKDRNIPLVVDPTVGTAINMDIISHCDFVVESLTKFANGNADLLAGAVIANPLSDVSQKCSKFLNESMEDIYSADIVCLSNSVPNYRERVVTLRNNVKQLVTYLESHPLVKRVYWSHSDSNIKNFASIERDKNSYVPVISVSFNLPIETVYDNLRLIKGPSFGTSFTLVMPYFYLAYFDQVTSEEGRKRLDKDGIDYDILRVSVGNEPISELVQAFETALDC